MQSNADEADLGREKNVAAVAGEMVASGGIAPSKCIVPVLSKSAKKRPRRRPRTLSLQLKAFDRLLSLLAWGMRTPLVVKEAYTAQEALERNGLCDCLNVHSWILAGQGAWARAEAYWELEPAVFRKSVDEVRSELKEDYGDECVEQWCQWHGDWG